MAYSALPITSTPNLRTIDTDTYIYISPPDNGLGKTGSAGSWTGITWGDDANGDGTLAKPFATLKRAWQSAQDYLIQGDAILYIQFQKGIYGYTYDANTVSTNPFPENLFHPQGDRVVIQGDPAGLKQRYLYRVSNYSWDLSRFTHYGHTGTVNLWRAQHAYGDTAGSYPSGNGNTAHGFTAEDNFGYVAISNAAMGVAYNRRYQDPYNGVHSGNKYQFAHNWGRAHFNHGLSYEEATAITGLARIEDASTNRFDLRLQFKNINLDGRVNTYPMGSAVVNGRIAPGLGTGLSYGGINSNYPEPQYAVPNGFYGPTFGVNENNTQVTPAWATDNVVSYGVNPNRSVNVTYPSRNGGEVHVTDDPHILSNYPVVIKVYSANAASTNCKPVPFVLDGCRIRSIRNLMLVNGDIEGKSYTQLNTGATLAPANGLEGFRYIGGIPNRTFARQCMTLRRGAQASIRHLGMLGWGNGISNSSSVVLADASVLLADPCVDASDYMTGQYGSGVLNANVIVELGRLLNTPVLMISHGGGVSVSSGSTLRLCHFDSSGQDQLPKNNHDTDQGSWIQTCWSSGVSVSGVGAKATLGSTTIVNATVLPGTYRLRMSLPVLPGMSAFGGSTGMFLSPNVFGNANGRGVTYNSIVGYKTTTTGRIPFCRITDIDSGGTFATSTRVSASWGGGLSPSYNETITMWGVKVHSPGMDVSEALRSFIDTVSGATVEFFAYHDGADGVTVANQYFGIGKNGVQIRVPGGVTYTATTTGNGFTYMFDGMTSLTGREDPISLYDFNSYPYQSILVQDHAHLESVGNISLSGKSYVAAYMFNSGRFYQRNGNFSVRDFTHSGIFCSRGSAFEVHDRTGMIITKHPVGYGIGRDNNPYSNLGHGIYCALSSSCTFMIPVVQVGIPYSNHGTANEAGRYVGFMSNSDAFAADYVAFFNTEIPNNSLLRCIDMSTVNFSAASAYPHTVSWDGGVGTESSNPEVGLISAAEASSFTGIGAIRHIWNPSMGFGSPAIQVGIMTRAPYGNATTSTSKQWLYNAPRGATLWFSTNSTGWIGSAAPSSPTNNYAYMDTVSSSGDALQKTFNEPQRAAAYTANPPGYSGPAVRTSNMMTVNPYGG
jgi:hypothetical protein